MNMVGLKVHKFSWSLQMSRHFELLNYSEHGTTVDNVLYSCDFSDKPATTPQPSPVVAAVREIINKGEGGNTTGKLTNSNRQNTMKPEQEEDKSEDSKELWDHTNPRMSARAHEVHYYIFSIRAFFL